MSMLGLDKYGYELRKMKADEIRSSRRWRYDSPGCGEAGHRSFHVMFASFTGNGILKIVVRFKPTVNRVRRPHEDSGSHIKLWTDWV